MKKNPSEKIKIALVAPSMKNLGGQSIQARRLLDAFSGNEQIEFDFIPNDPSAAFENVKFLRTLTVSLKFWLSLLRRIPKAKIVHIFSSGTTSYIISTLPPFFLAKVFGKKTILHYHTGEAAGHLEKWKLTAKPTMRRFDKIIVPSGFLVEVFGKFGLSASSIFNFVESERFLFRERRPLKPVFLSNRNFEAHYKVSDVLRAFRLIQDKFPEARLLIAGSGTEEEKLRNLAAELKLENAEFLGKIENERMPEIYARADVYLNSSVVDNMPLSIIEAFSCGLPVATTDAGGIPFICENERTALLVEKEDHKALARAAIRLLEDGGLAQKIIENARAECRKYAPEKVRGEWLELYWKLASE